MSLIFVTILNFSYSFLKEFRSRPVQLEQFCEYMKSLKINKNIIDNLKAFVQLEASVDDVCSVLQSKILSSGPRRKLLHTCFTDAVAEIREVAEVASIMGVKVRIINLTVTFFMKLE